MQDQCSDLLHPIPPSSYLEPCRTWHLSGVMPGSCVRWLSLELPCPWRHAGLPRGPLGGKRALCCGCSQLQFHLPPGATSSLTWSTGRDSASQFRGFCRFYRAFFIAPKQTAFSQASPFGKCSCFTFQVHPSIFLMQQRSWDSTLCLCVSHSALLCISLSPLKACPAPSPNI